MALGDLVDRCKALVGMVGECELERDGDILAVLIHWGDDSASLGVVANSNGLKRRLVDAEGASRHSTKRQMVHQLRRT